MDATAATISQGCCKNVDTTQKTIRRAKRTASACAVRRVAVAVTVSSISSSSIGASQRLCEVGRAEVTL